MSMYKGSNILNYNSNLTLKFEIAPNFTYKNRPFIISINLNEKILFAEEIKFDYNVSYMNI